MQRIVWRKFISELFVHFEVVSAFSIVGGTITLHRDISDHVNTRKLSGNTSIKFWQELMFLLFRFAEVLYQTAQQV